MLAATTNLPPNCTELLTNVSEEAEINDDIDFVQTLDAEDLTDRMVKFEPFSVWNNSEDNEVEYILPVGYSECIELFVWVELEIDFSICSFNLF